MRAPRRVGREGVWSVLLGVSLFALVAGRLGELAGPVGRVRPVLIVLVVAGAFLVRNFGTLGGMRIVRDRVFRLGVLYFVWMVLTVPFALWQAQALGAVRTIPIGLFLMFMLALVPPDPRHLGWLVSASIAAVVLVALLSLRSGQLVAGRLTSGGMLDPNDLASLFAAILPMSIVRYATPGRSVFFKFAALGAALILVMALLQTGSRGGMVAMLMGVLIVVARWRPRRVVVFTGIAVVLVPLIWAYTPPALRERFGTLTSLEEDYNMTDDYGRIATWTRGVGYFAEHPLVGLGYENFGVAEGERLRVLNRTGPQLTAHNTYIQVFAELGAPGGILFLLMLGEAVRRSVRLWRLRHPEYLAALGAFCTGAIFLSHAYSYTLFALLGVVTIASYTLDPSGSTQMRPRRSRMSSRRLDPALHPSSGTPART